MELPKPDSMFKLQPKSSVTACKPEGLIYEQRAKTIMMMEIIIKPADISTGRQKPSVVCFSIRIRYGWNSDDFGNHRALNFIHQNLVYCATIRDVQVSTSDSDDTTLFMGS